jgi:hypothetical protein
MLKIKKKDEVVACHERRQNDGCWYQYGEEAQAP